MEKLKSKPNFTVTITKTEFFLSPLTYFPMSHLSPCACIPISVTDPLVWVILILHMDDYGHPQVGFHCFLPRTRLLTRFLALLPSVAPYNPQQHFSE